MRKGERRQGRRFGGTTPSPASPESVSFGIVRPPKLTATDGVCPYTGKECIDEGGYCTNGDCLAKK